MQRNNAHSLNFHKPTKYNAIAFCKWWSSLGDSEHHIQQFDDRMSLKICIGGAVGLLQNKSKGRK